MIDETIGKQYTHLMCEDCKDKITNFMKDIENANPFKKARIYANPTKLALEVTALVCKDCLKKVRDEHSKK